MHQYQQFREVAMVCYISVRPKIQKKSVPLSQVLKIWLTKMIGLVIISNQESLLFSCLAGNVEQSWEKSDSEDSRIIWS